VTRDEIVAAEHQRAWTRCKVSLIGAFAHEC
jgi:hypothetical protein